MLPNRRQISCKVNAERNEAGQSIKSPLCTCNLQVRRGFRGGASRGVDYGPLDLEGLEDAAGLTCDTTSHLQLSYGVHQPLQALHIDKTLSAGALPRQNRA